MCNTTRSTTAVSKAVNTKSKKLLLSTTAILAGALIMPGQAVADNSWDYDTVLDGNVSKDVSVDTITDITVDGTNGFVEGNADIAQTHTVNVTGINGAKTFAYRDNRDNIESTLAGDLNSNIQIVIIDKDGVFFTDTSNIDVQGLVTTSADVAVDDIMNLQANGGTLVLNNVGDGGAITIDGNITVRDAGLAAFVSPFVTNNGTIKAKLGNVVMAAGETVTLDTYGDGLLEVAVDGELADALLENHGDIKANGGYVQITASALKNTVDNIINNTGLVTASSATVQGGEIILTADNGTIANNGVLKTNEGGSVDISGERFVQGDAPVPGKKPRILSKGGDVNITTDGNVEIYDGKINGGGGDIVIDNGGVFYSANAGSLKNEGEGTISLNQNKEDDIILPNVQQASAFISVVTPGVAGSIQNAIDAINNTGTGLNTINVGAGEYNEAVVVDHANMVLNGANAGVSALGPRGAESIVKPNSPGFLVISDNVTIDGFAIVGDGDDIGVEVDGAENVTVSNNKIKGVEYGVLANVAHNLTVSGNLVKGAAAHGLAVVASDDIIIEGNRIVGSEADGIRVRNGRDAVIANNRVKDSGDDGIDVDENDYVQIYGNRISGTQLNGTSYDGNAIEVNRSQGTAIFDNRAWNLGTDGIDLKRSRNSTVYGNVIRNAGDDGIDVDGVERITVYNNRVVNVGGEGFEITYAPDGTFYNNVVVGAGDDGIDVKLSDGIVIEGNRVKGAGSDGIQLVDSEGALIRGNRIKDTGENGIFVENALEASITWNAIRNTGTNGIYVSGSDLADVKFNLVKDAGANGIFVNPSDDVDIIGNFIFNSFNNGIYVLDGERALIAYNFVGSSGDNGINVYNNDDVEVKFNAVIGTGGNASAYGGNGIKVSRSSGALIHDNLAMFTETDGIDVKRSNDVQVYNNVTRFTGDDGIDVDMVADIEVHGNDVKFAGGEGIEVTQATNGHVYNNSFQHVADDGIDVKLSDGIVIEGNRVKGAGSDGIQLVDSEDAVIRGNNIHYTGENGIYVNNALSASIVWNNIHDTGTNGIYVSGSDYVDVLVNQINNTGAHGIKVNPSDFVDIGFNRIHDAGWDGIFVDGGIYADIYGNHVHRVGDDGIDVDGNYGVDIIGNTIRSTARAFWSYDGNGIEVSGSPNADIIFNQVLFAGHDGINVNAQGETNIIGNLVYGSGDDGIDVSVAGGYGSPSVPLQQTSLDAVSGYGNSVVIAYNAVSNSGDDGIHVSGGDLFYDIPLFSAPLQLVSGSTNSVVISRNYVNNSGGDGIQTMNIDELSVTDNLVRNSYEHGLYISGAYNGYVEFQGNTFEDNGQFSESAQARFESGDIDMSDLERPNTFINTTGIPATAMQFDDISAFYNDSPVNDGPTDEIPTGETDLPQLAVLVAQPSTGGTGLRIVGETLGSTVFEGYQPDGSFYVRFEDGSILDPLTNEPIIIDGTDASFDGVVPGTFPGEVLPLSTLQFIEDRLYDADDETVDGRGQIFVGFAPDPLTLDNQQDFLREFAADRQLNNVASVRINGLPSTGGGLGNLNNIAPNAGGEGEGESSDLANIEPNAGDSVQEVTCLADAVSALGQGAVNYNFGGTFEDGIASTESCASAEL